MFNFLSRSFQSQPRPASGERDRRTGSRGFPHDPVHQLQTLFSELGFKKIASDIEDMPISAQKVLALKLQGNTLDAERNEVKITPSRGKITTAQREGDVGGVKLQQTGQKSGDASTPGRRLLELEEQLRLADEEVRDLKEREQKLLVSILDNSTGEETLDSDVVQSFRSLRQQIQRLANNRTYANSGKSTCPFVPQYDDHDQFYTVWQGESRKDRIILMRVHMFRILYKYILGHNYFGVSAAASATHAERREFLHIDTTLSHFETLLQNRRVPDSLITDWRVATLKCVRLGNLTEDLGTEVAQYMYRCFERMIAEDVDSSELKTLHGRFLQLCQDAIKLRLLMRGSREGYECIKLRSGTDLAANEDIAEVFAIFRGDDDEMGDKIEFTMFGALVKHPKYRGEEELILDKAHVVMARHSRDEQQ